MEETFDNITLFLSWADDHCSRILETVNSSWITEATLVWLNANSKIVVVCRILQHRKSCTLFVTSVIALALLYFIPGSHQKVFELGHGFYGKTIYPLLMFYFLNRAACPSHWRHHSLVLLLDGSWHTFICWSWNWFTYLPFIFGMRLLLTCIKRTLLGNILVSTS